jgi:hypothetical protein
VPTNQLVSRAIDHVLETELEAQAAVVACETESKDELEHARQQRRAAMERAQSRIVAMHARAAQLMQARIDTVTELRRQASVVEAMQFADPERRAAALARLAQLLTTSD